jgi:hypothetical protein
MLIALCLFFQPTIAYSLENYDALTLESAKVFEVPKPINYKLKHSNGFFWGINKTNNSLNIIQFNRSRIFLDPLNSVQIKTLEFSFNEDAFLSDFEIVEDCVWLSLNYFNLGHVHNSLIEYNTKTDKFTFYPYPHEYPVTYEASLPTILCYDKEKGMIYFLNNNCGLLFFFSLENKQWLNNSLQLNDFYVTALKVKNKNLYICGQQLSHGKGFAGYISLDSLQSFWFAHERVAQFDAFVFDLEGNMWCLSKSEKILSLFNSNHFVDYNLNPMAKATDLILDNMKGNIWLTDTESQKVYRFCLLNKAFAIHFRTNPLIPTSLVSDEKNFTWIFGATNDGHFGFTCVEKAYDVNNDYKVDMKDLGIVLRSLWKTQGDMEFIKRIDIENDGIISMKDLAYIVKYLHITLY